MRISGRNLNIGLKIAKLNFDEKASRLETLIEINGLDSTKNLVIKCEKYKGRGKTYRLSDDLYISPSMERCGTRGGWKKKKVKIYYFASKDYSIERNY